MAKEVEQILSGVFENKVLRSVQITGRNWSPVIEKLILVIICIVCFFIRLFAVIRYESVIHEFDPYFNYRTTNYLSTEGFYEFWNWFDNGSWYPLGRVIGQTLYPGLMSTSAIFYYVLNYFGILINIRNMCVFMAPIFSALTAIAGYLLTKEVTGQSKAGLLSAILIGICPSYISRSVAGSYDNEAIAIFALTNSFYLFVKAIHTGSMVWGVAAAIGYFYMVSSWGGYVFVINTIAIFIFGELVLGKLTVKHYVVYAVFYVIGTIFCLNVPFVNFQAITSSEHMASHGMFIVSTAAMFVKFLRTVLPSGSLKILLRGIIGITSLSFLIVFVWMTLTGRTKWQGRSMTLLDPTYASKYIPIIASVSEHQPTTWSSYIMDMHVLPFLAPLGMYFCFTNGLPGGFFLGIYGILSAYFSGVMVRLLLVMAPAVACLAGVGASNIVSIFVTSLSSLETETAKTKKISRFSIPRVLSLIVIGLLGLWLFKYVKHCVWISAMAYSQPSIVMSSQMRDGTRVIQDDFREAYYWLRQNTPEDSKILSWWDYGYQITVMGNRTVLVDNNTWNNTHIATVGLILSSTEDDAYPLLQKLDVDYVLVLYGGVARYSSDDINKFLWPIRIANGEFPDKVSESDFIGPAGFAVDSRATSRMKNSVMYKLCYYRAAELTQGFDHVRNQQIGVPRVKPKYFDEVFTSENWIVRIYLVRKPANRGTLNKNAKWKYELKNHESRFY